MASSAKISQLPLIQYINANTANTYFVGVDIANNITGHLTVTTLASGLFSNNALVVGQNPIIQANTVAQFSGSNPSYIQLNMQNFNSNGSSDFVATSTDGTDTTNYIDMGIQGSADYDPVNATAYYPRDGYLYVQGNVAGQPGGNLIIGTSTTATHVKFVVGGMNNPNTVARMYSNGTTILNNLTVPGTLIANTGTTYFNSSYFNGYLNVINSIYNSSNPLISISAATNGASQLPSNTDYVMQITGKEYLPTRLVMDNFGAGNTYPVFVGRSGRGTAASPTASQSGDTLLRISGNGYGATGFNGIGVGRIDIVATENFTDTNHGSQFVFASTTNGSNTLSTILTMNGQTASFSGNLIATNLTVSGNVLANNFISNTSFINASVQSLTANTVQANTITLANTTINNSIVTTGNVQSNNIIANSATLGTATVNGSIVLSDSGLYQYNTSNNSTVTQTTSKSTGVTCNGRTGQITTSSATLAKGASVTFTVTNNQIISTKDVVIVNIGSGATTATYTMTVTNVSVGSFDVTISNNGAASASDTLVINFAIIRVN